MISPKIFKQIAYILWNKSFEPSLKLLAILFAIIPTRVWRFPKFFYTLNFKSESKEVFIDVKIQLEKAEPVSDANTEELAKILLARFGLVPRKKDGTAKFHQLLLELYERKKLANKEKKPEHAVMPVEEMGVFAGIKRQTMYDYLHRWLDLGLLKKTSFVADGKVVIGYELNGTSLDGAFRKAETVIRNHIDDSFKVLEELQNKIKKEKISQALSSSSGQNQDQPDSSEPEEL